MWANATVFKLAGFVALKQQKIDIARQRFESSIQMDPDDCDVQFELGSIHAEQRNWPLTTERFVITAGCLERARQGLEEEIRKIGASNASPERKARQIAKREQQLVLGRRMLATSWFNTAVANFNLSRKTEAREYAQKVTDDEQFGARARDLLSRLDKMNKE